MSEPIDTQQGYSEIEEQARAAAEARAALGAPAPTRANRPRGLAISIGAAALLAVAAELIGLRFFDDLVERVGLGLAVLLLLAIVATAVILRRRASERSINERLFEEAESQGLLMSEKKAEESERAPEAEASTAERAGQSPLSLPVIAALTGIDLVALVILLTVSQVAGVILFVVSAAVLSLWLNLRLRRIRSSVRAERDRQGEE